MLRQQQSREHILSVDGLELLPPHLKPNYMHSAVTACERLILK